MKSFDVLSTKAIAFFEREEMKKEPTLAKATLDKLSDMTQSIMSKTYNAAKGVYSDLKSGLSSLFSTNKDKSVVTSANNDNSFSELTKSFNDMKNESLVILEEIKTAVIDISKNRVQVNPIANVGNATTTDNKLQTPLNVVVNNPTQGELLDAIKSINSGVMSIVKNTALDDSGKFKNNAATGGVWAID